MSDPFIAEIKIFAGNFAPRGWAFCNGQLLPIAQNTALFSLIGTIYGGDGRTTTALPNMQGRLPMHPGNGPGLTQRRLGEKGGSATVNLTSNQTPGHGHAVNPNPAADPLPLNATVKTVSSRANHGFEGGHLSNTVDSNRYQDTAAPDQAMHAGSVDIDASTENAGSGQPHNNLPPYLALNYIIALTGTYPSRS